MPVLRGGNELLMTNDPDKKKEPNWFQEWLTYGGSSVGSLLPMLMIGVIMVLATVILRLKGEKSGSSNAPIVAYVAQDQIYAESLLEGFQNQTGVSTKGVFDSEAVKTVGLANRLLAERDHPQCDVFWGNEEMRTRQLAEKGVFEKWAAFGHRSRQLVVNTNFVQVIAPSPRPFPPGGARETGERVSDIQEGEIIAPKSLLELTNAVWRGRVALAYPLFGTTATHFLALRQHWGEAGWLAWCKALAANKPFVVDGNSVVVKLVGKGEAWIGLTDSDDIAAAQREGQPVVAGELEETLLIPNTVAMVKGAPHRESGLRLFDYLQTRAVADVLVAANALQGADLPTDRGLKPDWSNLLVRLENDTTTLKEIFLR